MKHLKLIILLCVCEVFTYHAWAQNTISPENPFIRQDSELLRAQQLEQQKEYVQAKEIYERLYERDGTDVLFWKLLMLYDQTGDYGAMEVLAAKRLEERPGDLSSLRYLARAYYGQGDERKGRKALFDIIGDRWGDQQRVFLMANELELRGDLDGVVEVYTTARKKTGEEMEYASELGRIYAMRDEQVKAIREYLILLDMSPQTFGAVIRDTVNKLQASPSDTGNAIREIRRYLGDHPASIEAAKILADMYYRNGVIEDAYDALIDPAVLAGAANDVWQFAFRLKNDGHISVALRAFEDYQEYFKKDKRSVDAIVEAAEIKNQMGNTDGAAKDYNRLLEAFPGTEQAAVASLRMIELYRGSMSNEGYQRAMEDFAGTTPYRKASFVAWLTLGKHTLRQGDFKKANDAMMKAVTKATSKQEFYAVYRQYAYINYYQGDFKAMAESIDQCVVYAPESRDVNDLLELRVLSLMAGNAADSAALATIAVADHMLYRGDMAGAIERFTSAASDSSEVVVPYAAKRLGDIHSTEDPSLAVEWYLKAAAAETDSTRRTADLMRAGDLAVEMLGDMKRAERIYLQALTDTGGSVYAGEIRRKLREVIE